MVIYNRFIPIKGFIAMAIFPFIFVRGKTVSEKTLNHERIHFEQQKELWIIPFYLLYLIFTLTKGYKNNPFEVEAYKNDSDFTYLSKRNKFAWRKLN